MFSKTWILALGLVLVSAVSIAQGQVKKGEQANINTFPDCTAAPGNLITNCRFDTGDFTSWIWGGDTSASGVSTGCGQSGAFCAHMGPVSYNGTLTQCFSAPSGTCSLSFWIRNSGQPSHFAVEWHTNKIMELYYVPNFPYEQFLVSGLSGGFGCLTFEFFNSPSWIDLTDVAVVCP
jgi:hypothetical protein